MNQIIFFGFFTIYRNSVFMKKVDLGKDLSYSVRKGRYEEIEKQCLSCLYKNTSSGRKLINKVANDFMIMSLALFHEL